MDLNGEVVDPENWVPEGHVCFRVHSRATGGAKGLLDIWSHREAQDVARCGNWAGAQSRSNGTVAINGLSDNTMNA